MANRSIAALIIILGMTIASCARDPEILKREHVANGDRYVAEKKYAEAIIEYRNAIAQDRRFGEARYKLAGAYETIGDLRNALAEYIRAADLMADNIDAQLHAGKLLVGASRFPEAKARAQAVLTKDPKNINALIVLGNSLAGLKDIEGAISQIEEAIETEPRLSFSYTNLGVLQLGTGNRAAAEAAFNRAIKADPKSIAAHLNLGNLYWAARQGVEAEKAFKTALAIDEKSADVNRTLAAFYITSGRQATAEPYLKTYAAVGEGAAPKLGLADFYLNSGRTKDAVGILEPLRKEEDGFRPASLRLATIEFKADRRQESYKLLEEILNRFPKDPQALVLKSGFLRVDGKLDEALAAANAVAEANPAIASAHIVRGEALAARGFTDEAIKAFRRVLELEPSAVPARTRLASLVLARGDEQAAISLLNEVLRAEPFSGPAHFLMGQAQLQAGNLVRAEAELVPIAKANPKSADVQTWLGRLYGAKDDRVKARQAFNTALELAPDSLPALNGVVTLDLVDKKFDSARAKLEPRLAANPEDRSLLFLAGNVYLAMADHQKAESLFRKLLQIDADNIEVYSRLAGLYLTQGRLDEAKKAFEDLGRHQTRPVAAATMIGMIFDMQGKSDEARKQYTQALAIDPNAAVAANNLAFHYAETGQNLDVALQLAQTAKAKLPDSAQVSDTLGWVLYKKGLAGAAITHLRFGAQQNPSNPRIHYHLGLAYFENGETADARRSLEHALKLNPQFRGAEDARRALAALKG